MLARSILVLLSLPVGLGSPPVRAQGGSAEVPPGAASAGVESFVGTPSAAAAMSVGQSVPAVEAAAAVPQEVPDPSGGTPPTDPPAPSPASPAPPLAPEAGPRAPSAPADAGGASTAAAAASAVVARFHQSLRDNDREGVLGALAPDVAIFEQGYIESSRDDYARGHLDNDLLFAATTRYEVMHREAAAEGDTAWVITQARTAGSFAGQDLDLDSTETAILERRDGRWLIVHLHWSAHPRSE